MYQHIFIDLDGTVTDPALGITNSTMFALEHYGIHVADRSELYPFIGPPLQDSFMEIFGFSQKQASEAIGYYREYFQAHGMYENRLYDGVRPMLETLKNQGKSIVLATSKPEFFAEQILEHFDIRKYFSAVAGATMDDTRCEKPDVLRYAMEKIGLSEADKGRAVMVGDRRYDLEAAEKVGIDSIGVLYGYGSLEELKKANATHLAASVEDISRICNA